MRADVQSSRWPAMIEDLVRHYKVLWHDCDTSLPWLGPPYARSAQRSNEKCLDHFLATLSTELKGIPQTSPEQLSMWARIDLACRNIARVMPETDERAIDTLLTCGFREASVEFARMARRFDPTITSQDIYQASRNVWMANLIQLLLGMPVVVTPAIFAYSMLYPYSDNYIDDPTIPEATKLVMNEHIHTRLMGAPLAPCDKHERSIFDLIGMIEAAFDRASYPDVFQSLLAIQRAQGQSLHQMHAMSAPYPIDVLGISFAKGGASVLADGYLVAGELTDTQREWIFGFGVLTQLMDDLEDLPQDLADGSLTIFSEAVQKQPLDTMTSRVIQLSTRILTQLGGMSATGLSPFLDLLRGSVILLVIDSASRSARFYPERYLRQLETHSPFRFGALRQRRKHFGRQQVSLRQVIDLIDTLAAPASASDSA